ncbi:MAG TPA: hypothetical protein VFO07_05455 [Roseiflexaceae bacterium]|nr:hypothetical protein [Roseiflexaceae bacterium]
MRRYAPVFVLFALSPLVAEVLFGATTLSRIGGLLPTSLLYGGGVVLIRELARRRSAGWGRIALLGVAYALVEEGLAIGSLFNPNLFNAGIVGGRLLGINWVWTEWTIGYHVVWSIIIPILLAELLFPDRRAEPWLGKVGVAVAGAVYALGALAIGAIFRFAVAPDFHIPTAPLLIVALIAAAFVALALGWPAGPPTQPAREPLQDAPSPWLVAIVMVVAAAAWFVLLDLPRLLRDNALVLVPMLGELALVWAVVGLLRSWSAPGRRWTDLHRLALAGGLMMISMLVGFFFVTAGNPVDQLGQGVAGLVAIALLALFARRLQQGRLGNQGRPLPSA